MEKDDSENDLVLSPGVFGRGGGGAAWRAALVFVVGYVVPFLVLGRTSLSGGIQWVAILLTYFLISLMVYRLLENRSGVFTAMNESVLSDAESPPPAGALDEIVGASGEAKAGNHKPTAWSPELLHQLDWKRLVDLCLAYFADRFQCKAGRLAEDGSVEIQLFKEATERPVAIVYCRAWGEREVGLETLENLSVQMAQGLIAKGFCMGYGGFSDEARAFAKNHAITLIDEAMFISMLNRLPDERKAQLLALAVDGDYAVPTCPECGLKMIARQHEQARYWGCRAYPRCKGVLVMRPKRRMAVSANQGA